MAGGDAFDPAEPGDLLARGGEVALWAMGVAALSLDDHATAHRFLGPLTDALLGAGIAEPGELRPVPDEVEALAGLGRVSEALVLGQRFDVMAERSGRPAALGNARRTLAIVEAATGHVESAMALAEEACTLHEPAHDRFGSGRSLLVLGTIQRRTRQKRAARESLAAAIATFEALGAPLWVDKANAEMRRIGGRAGTAGELTPTERRAAELVAEGHSNKEVASALFVSPKTVEANLSRVYAKLGVQSRTELVRRLSEERAAGDRESPT